MVYCSQTTWYNDENELELNVEWKPQVEQIYYIWFPLYEVKKQAKQTMPCLEIQRDAAKHGNKNHKIQNIGFKENTKQSGDEGRVTGVFKGADTVILYFCIKVAGNTCSLSCCALHLTHV